MSLTKKQKKYIKEHIHYSSTTKISKKLNVKEEELSNYLKRVWRKDKYQRIVIKDKKNKTLSYFQKAKNFQFKKWLKDHYLYLGALAILVLIVYFNSFNNEFLSDDISGIVNENLNNFHYVIKSLPTFLSHFFYYLVNAVFGKAPWAFRSLNILFHLGNVLLVYFLISLLVNDKTAIISAIIFAVHPLLIESVSWISGLPYTQSAFFVLAALTFYILSFQKKSYYYFSNIFFLLALFSSSKAIVYPFLLFALELSNNSLKRNWRKLIIPFGTGLFWTLFSIGQIPERLEALETQHYQKKQTINPFFQIPVAISSYLILLFWPQKLTLYHSELSFNNLQFIQRVAILLIYLTALGISFFKKKYRRYFFWLAFFSISLLPTLTPFGISWIVAERYVYLGAVGIIAVFAIIFSQLFKNKKTQPLGIILLIIITLTLGIRTIIRNNDWQNQDNLWLAAGKISLHSPQNHNNLGDMYARHGNYEESIRHYQLAIKLKPGYADAYHNMAITYRKMENIDAAIKNYEKAIELNANLWQSCQDLAVIYFNQNNYEMSQKYAQMAIKVVPKNGNLYANLAMIYNKMGKAEKARQIIKEGLKLDPQNIRLRKLLIGAEVK